MFDVSGAPTTAEPPPGPPGHPIDLSRISRALVRGVRWLALAGALGAVAGFLIAKLLVERQYTAEAVLLWEPVEPDEEVTDERALRTLVDSVELPDNLAAVRRKLELDIPLAGLGEAIRVVSAEDSDLVLIEADWSDPAMAARIGNVLVATFLHRRRTVDLGRRLERVDELQATVREARGALSEARAAYDALRSAHGIADLSTETRVAIEHEARLRSDADAAVATASSQQAVNERLTLAAEREPETLVLTEQETRPALLRLVDTRAELEAARARLTEEHPEVRRLQAQERALADIAFGEGALVAAQQTIGRNPQLDALRQGAMRADAMRVANEEQHDALQRMARSAAGRVQQLVSLEGEIAELESALAVRARLMQDAEASLALAIDAARTPRAGFRSLALATPPIRPRASKRRAVMLLVPLLALLAAALLLLSRELYGLRPHSCHEVAYWLGSPVVATTRWPIDPRAFGEFVADVDALEARGHGGSILLALSEEEERIAPNLAAALAGKCHDASCHRGTAVHFRHGGATDLGARRAARASARVLLIVTSGAHTARRLRAFRRVLGPETKLGVLLVGVGVDLAHQPDRAGDVDALWRPTDPSIDIRPARTQ